MTRFPLRAARKAAGTAIALSLSVVLAGCGGVPMNASLDSVHQPVVENVNYTIDVMTGMGGLSLPEQRRLSGWFDAMGIRYGDRIAIDDPTASGTTREAVEMLAARHGLLVSDDAPVTPGALPPGSARIVITRAKASVPGCPDWSTKSDFNPNNATHSNFGCAINGNLAAMVANPEHLIKGAQGGSETVVMSSTKAIDTYRGQVPTGQAGLKTTASSGN